MKDEFYRVCSKCGNKEKFVLRVTRTVYIETKILTDTNLDQKEELDESTYDAHPSNDDELIECYNCESDDIIEDNILPRYYSYIQKHTREDGTWSEKELPENERNKELLQTIMIEQLKRDDAQ